MRATWYFDVISPYAYLHFRQFDRLPAGLTIEYVPVLFAGLLKAHGHKGPAEIVEKRRQTYRMCVWQARESGIAMRFPPAHPFNPLHVLRLIVAAGATQAAVAAAFEVIWESGLDPNSPPVFAALAARMGIADPDAAIADPRVKQGLADNTARALARGVYGVPTFDCNGELFWGSDTLSLMRAFVADPRLFDEGEFARVDRLPMAATRRDA
ncbi:MAG: 2-hydroxychromene-2-carboxylate isomerase [Burkholderiales bacterium]|nr:2-hydroxychromene-2-carboxylate isomerase [Burkholderiales bacterium]